MLRILAKAIFLSVPHIDLPSSQQPSSAAMARHAKSQSISSDTPNAKGVKTPPPKFPAPVKATARRSTASPPVSPASSFTPVRSMPPRKSQIPVPLQFPLVVVLSFSLSTLLYSLIAEIGTGELASISKHLESWLDAAGLLAWKAVLLAVCWFGGFDAYDTLSLSLLVSTPHNLLLYSFYSIRPTTLMLTALAFITSNTVPFLLLRPISPPHQPSTAAKGTLRNRPILTDPWTTISTSLLATAIFAVLLELAFATYLPTWLITHFDYVRDLSAAHLGAAGLPTLLLSLLPAGYAAHEFLFASSTGVRQSPEYVFEPETAGFWEHVFHNTWGWYSNRQKDLIGRTLLLAALVEGETIIQTWGTIKGAELVGAAGYATLWGAAVCVVGAVFDWVGGPSG